MTFLLADLGLDDDNESNELQPVSVAMVTANTNDMESKRDQALDNGKHLCMELDGK